MLQIGPPLSLAFLSAELASFTRSSWLGRTVGVGSLPKRISLSEAFGTLGGPQLHITRNPLTKLECDRKELFLRGNV